MTQAEPKSDAKEGKWNWNPSKVALERTFNVFIEFGLHTAFVVAILWSLPFIQHIIAKTDSDDHYKLLGYPLSMRDISDTGEHLTFLIWTLIGIPRFALKAAGIDLPKILPLAFGTAK
jgi:hypothetical protein